MNMIFDSSDLERSHLVLSSDAADVSPDATFDLLPDPGFAILGAENVKW